MLADVFENPRNICLKGYELDPACFLNAPRLAWQAAVKKTKVKLDILTDINMLLIVEKGIKGGICHTIHQSKLKQKLITKTWKISMKNKESPYLKYWDVNDLYGCEMSKKFPINCFIWVENTR